MYSDTFISETTCALHKLCHNWGLSQDTEIALLNLSENATFRATDPNAAEPIILRLHRPAYHTLEEIESELVWIDALRREGVVDTPEPLTTRQGARIVSYQHGDDTRHVVGFAFMEGAEPDVSADLVDGFVELGAISARLHGHVGVWTRPARFARKTWDFDTTLGDRPHWGAWRDGLGLTDDGRAVLQRACAQLHKMLADFGAGPDRFGLIHADLRLANLLVHGGRIGVIDFDDCGFGWYGYDFAAAVSFLETDPIIPALQDAWVRGYRTVAPLSAADEAMLPVFVLLRRILLTAWIAGHAETQTAADAGGAGYTDGTLDLAERFLAAA